jgi:glycosyltransferase involved in cell wall biosynthesis
MRPEGASDRNELSVSVVVNNYNYGRFIGDAIDSVIAQTVPALEILVVDDGSTDNSRDIIESFGDLITPVFKSNGGQTSAFNIGFQHAKGDLICFLDADDFLEPTALASFREKFRNPHIVKVHWPLEVIGADGARTGKRKPSHQLHEGKLTARLLELGPDDPAWVPTSGNAWKRSFLEKIFPLPEPESLAAVGSASADASMSMLAPLYGEIAQITEPQGCYRVHGSNDHSCMNFERRMHRDIVLFELRAERLLTSCCSLGLSPNPERWRDNAWCHKLKRAVNAIERTIPEKKRLVLADDTTLQLFSEKFEILPFLEDKGEYAGLPGSCLQAIRELERMRKEGSEYFVHAWPSFWWREYYPEFTDYLRSRYNLITVTNEVAIYHLAPISPRSVKQST